MAEKIYKLFLVRPNSRWYGLTKEEQDSLLGKVQSLDGQAGAKQLYLCKSSWSNEQWPYFGLEEFPDLAAVQKHSQLLEELNWPYEFCRSFSILGSAQQ